MNMAREEQNEAVTKAMSNLAHALRGYAGKGAKTGARHAYAPTAESGLFELMAAEGPFEEVIVCRSLGTAKVYIKGNDLFIVPNGKLHRLTGEEVGWYTGVFRAKVTDDLLEFPPRPRPPFDRPSSIPDFRKKLHPTKAIWKFGDGSIIATGPANSYVIPLKDRSAQLVISIAMVITNGTGRYNGALGTISSLGATWFPFVPGLSLKDTLKDGAIFEAKGVHGFRITRQVFQAKGEDEGGYEDEDKYEDKYEGKGEDEGGYEDEEDEYESEGEYEDNY
jgi:hypothetical protein